MSTSTSIFFLLSLIELSLFVLCRWIPVFADDQQRLAVVSIGFLLKSNDDAVIWRGPKKTAMIKQFITDVSWGDLDYLVIDTPPGTSDEHLSIMEALREHNPDGAVLVTTPQGVALADVRKELNFCRKVSLPILGVIENMSGYACPNCSECFNLFSKGGGEAMAKEFSVPFLGQWAFFLSFCPLLNSSVFFFPLYFKGGIPIDPQLTMAVEQGKNLIQHFPDSVSAKIFKAIATTLDSQLQHTSSSQPMEE